MNRQATAARLTADAAQAVADASSSSAVYGMLGAFTEVNARQLHRTQFEKFEGQTVEYRPLEKSEPQTVEYEPPVCLQTRPPPASLVGRLRAALQTMFHATPKRDLLSDTRVLEIASGGKENPAH
jgi:hypothetical protein